MTVRSRPEDIEYISRLKFGSQFNYTPEFHSKSDVEGDNYFHNISTRYLAAGDEIRLRKIGEPCPHDVVIKECSAIARMVVDYGDLRRKIRAANEKE